VNRKAPSFAEGASAPTATMYDSPGSNQGARIDWASLLKRVFFEDVMACPCGGRRRILADVEEPAAIVAILRHLGLPTEAPPIARARDPAELGFGFE
jgi:hypothetical protein